jgi:hypothetical protein
MAVEHKALPDCCPVTLEELLVQIRQQFEDLLRVCQQVDGSFWEFEKCLRGWLATLACALVRLFLTARHERLNLQPYLQRGTHRLGEAYAPRKLKTLYGELTYGRAHLIALQGGPGFYPLDAVLGLTRDHFSPGLMYLVARLATRLSYPATRLVCRAILGWSPATEAIEQAVLGLGRQAAPFMQQQEKLAGDGEVLVIEVDGKCPPTATAEELRKRRGKRRPRGACACGCQRHRGRCQRRARGSKKRRKKGDHSKNGKEAVVVVMYTLHRGEDGQLHGPLNKKVWASFSGRLAAARWARAAATRRGFGPETTKTVQIVIDGVQGLRENLEPLFPQAIFTLDICHVVEKLWDLGHRFHAEGSEALAAQVEEWKALVYQGRARDLVQRLRQLQQQVPSHGPGTKGRREALRKLIGYLEPRLSMMHYKEWIDQDLVIASGQVEGAVRHVVGERLDCAGMRWLQGKAEALLQLRCLELNGDWEPFVAWVHQRHQEELLAGRRLKILTDQALMIQEKAA